jgi:Protein of unknown function (DUF3616)
MERKTVLIGILMFCLFSTSFQRLEILAQIPKTEIYKEMCDASAAAALDDNTFIVANDEDNILRIFERNKPIPLQTVKLSEVFANTIFDGKKREIDLEGAAQLGNKIFWIGSHSTNKDGESRPDRHRLFAITVKRGANGRFNSLSAGQIYTTLIADLEKDSRFDGFKLKEAKALAPKVIGGLSIEGLAATPDGALMIGFRNPLRGGNVVNGFLVGGKSLIVKLLNPLEVIEGKPARFDAPLELDLGSFGIRSLEYYAPENKYLIVAGAYHENEETPSYKREVSRVYNWSEKSNNAPTLLKKVNLTGFNIEAAFFFPQIKNRVELFSDDGKSTTCTETDKMFRGLRQKF